MTKINSTFVLILLLSFCNKALPGEPANAVEKRISKMLQNMTLEQKIGQTSLRGMSSRNKGEITEELKDAVRAGEIGAFLNVMDKDSVRELQRIASTESQTKIPLLFGRDVIHGFKTIAPIPIGMASTWDPPLVEKVARNSAIEASTYGVRWTYAPMVDVTHDARWGRIAESLGEDPLLASDLAIAMVKGFQGDDLSDPTSLAACVKHYAGYGAAEGGRDYNGATISESVLRDIYLPPFKAAVDAGAASVMTSFNELNGIPATGNYFLLTQILKKEWAFDGFIVSDWESLSQMVPHGYARDNKHAAERAATAGMDMEMMSTAYENHLAELIQEGAVKESQLDDFVRRILRIKMRLGLFENSKFSDNNDIIQSSKLLDAARQIARESVVLLKNKSNILPLDKTQIVAVIGPLADAPHEQLGTWVYDSDKSTTLTPLFTLKEFLGGENVIYEPALAYSRSYDQSRFDAAIKAAKKADVVLFFGGEEAILSGEAHSRADIRLPGAQEELIRALANTGTPVVLIIMAGRPISVYNINDSINALMMAWHPGTMGGPAIVDLLFGKYSPSGRLVVTWPKTSGQIPIYYNHTNTGRPPVVERIIPMSDIKVGTWQSALDNTSYYLDLGHAPQYPFGYGLTYSSFEYKKLHLSKSVVEAGDTLEVSVILKNTGKRLATEIAQLYVQDIVGEVTRPIRELKAYQKVTLLPGKSKRLTFNLSAQDLSYHNAEGKRVLDPGRFNLWIGPNAEEGLKTSFVLK